MTMIIDGTLGETFPDGSLQPAAASPYVLRNRIINGAMQVWQRGTTFTFGNGANTYTTDRWWGVCNTASGETVSQSTNVPSGFQYSLKMQRPNGNTGTQGLNILQIIETANCYDLAGQSVTLSFWAKTGANYSGGALSVYLQTGTVADEGNSNYFSWTGRATPLATTQSITSTWTRYSFTTTIASNALEVGVQLQFTPTGTAGADDSVYITGVQLEIGTSATPFERRLYNQELANCQRYFQTISNGAGGSTQSATSAIFGFQFPVVMRTAPSGAVTAPIRISDISTSAFTQSSGNIVGNLVTADGGSWQIGNFTGMTVNRPIILAQFSTGTIQLSAEL